MKYLGEGSRKEDIAKVIGAMRSEVLERRELNKEAKLRVFSATAVPTLLYGRDTWTVQKWQESRSQATEILEEGGGSDKAKQREDVDIRPRLNQEAVMKVVRIMRRA